MKRISKFLKIVSAGGFYHGLIYRNETKYKSSLGGIVTILCIIGLVYYSVL
jgi:hypothetical protein